MDDWADETFGSSEPLSAKKGKKSLSFIIIIVKTWRQCQLNKNSIWIEFDMKQAGAELCQAKHSLS